MTKLKEQIKAATPLEYGSQAYLVGGKGVKDVVPRGGSDAVLPAWRDSLVHFWFVISVLLSIGLLT